MADSATAPGKGRTFVSRFISSVLLWLLLGYAMWAGHIMMFQALAALFGLATAWEYYRLLGQHSYGRWGMIVTLGYWTAVIVWGQHGYGMDLAVLVAALQGSFFIVYREGLKGEETLLRVWSTVGGVFYSCICYAFLLRLAFYPGEGPDLSGVALLLFCIMVTKFSDMGAYAIGSLIGRHKMVPHISPAKSWEGLAGAFLGGFLACAGMMTWAAAQLHPLTWTTALIITPVLVLTAVSGDLAESVLKRCVATKDSGHSLPGIGGVLDLTDSLLFTAPVFYAYLRLCGRA